MSTNNEQKWRDATQQILQGLDITAEYRELGLNVSSRQPNSSGWVPARAMGRDDNSPSAGINVSTGALCGRYKDFGGKDGVPGECLSLFDFAAKYGNFKDWQEARVHYARKAGVKLPRSAEVRPLDKFDDFTLTPSGCLTWCRTKPPITWQAVMEAGAMGKIWPNDAPDIGKNHLISFPMYGQYLTDADPIGYQSVHYGGKKIQVYNGPNAPPESRAKQSNGPHGLMNAYALERLEKAKRVWLLEGLTSMLALQSIIPKDGEAVAISYGAASYHPRPEWLHHFTGKDVLVIGDVDPSGVGQSGAEVWCQALLANAASVRNVVLPYEPDEDKSDLRDWINDELCGEKIDEENSARIYCRLCELASGVAPIPADRPKEESIEPHQVILQCLGCVVLGKVEDTSHIECFSTNLKNKFVIKDINRFSDKNLLMELGGEVFDQYITLEKTASEGKFTVVDVQRAIAREAAMKSINPELPLGAGVWRIEDELVLVSKSRADVWDGREFTEITSPFYKEKQLEFGKSEWYPKDKLEKYLNLATDANWRRQQVQASVDFFNRWDNWEIDTNGDLITGLVMATRLQSVWHFRPMVALSGPTNSGKSWLLDYLRDLLLIEEIVSKPSAAAIRSKVRHMSHPVLIDEFEHCRERQNALDDFRVSSTGDGIITRSTSSGKEVRYRMRQVFWVAGIELGLKDGPDKNRYIFLNLNAVENKKNNLNRHDAAEAADRGLRLMACIMRTWKTAINLMEEIRKDSFLIGEHEVARRLIECFGTPVACLAAAKGMGVDEAKEEMVRILRGRTSIESQSVSDEETLIEDILSSVINLPGGDKSTPSELLTAAPDTKIALKWSERDSILQTHGIRLMLDPIGRTTALFIAPTSVKRHLLQNTDHKSKDITQILRRVHGAQDSKQKISGQNLRGVIIPVDAFDKVSIPNCPSDDFDLADWSQCRN